ncbi:MAG: transcriptional regulator, MerR family [Microbacteriaceae bacterium]|nr:transcriptional regulator, MerR family [Microbacteriaceae bacterium]
MFASLSIGDFARATNLSVKTLRYYHEAGLLEPAEIDANSGYRRYSTGQIPVAQVIRRFRALDMPLGDIREVLEASDITTRNELIAAHTRRLEIEIERTRTVVASLRNLLDHPNLDVTIEHRSIASALAAAITEVVDLADAAAWYQGALGELHATLAAQGVEPAGIAGGIFSTELFTDERGSATVFIPVASELRALGRVAMTTIPAVELAVIEHLGAPEGVDLAYGALGTYVTEHALAVDGPLREYYVVGPHESADPAEWRTEIGWPIFATS